MIVFQKKKRDRYPHYVVSFKIKKRKVWIFKQEKQTIFLYWTWKRIVSKYDFKTWMCEFNILYDEKCLIYEIRIRYWCLRYCLNHVYSPKEHVCYFSRKFIKIFVFGLLGKTKEKWPAPGKFKKLENSHLTCTFCVNKK